MNLVLDKKIYKRVKHFKTAVTAQKRYITSLLSLFSTHLDKSSLSIDEKLAAQELLVEFIDSRKQIFNITLNSLQTWLKNKEPGYTAEIAKPARQILIQFAKTQPLHQTEIFLYEFLLALKEDKCSKSTVKNYRSDINQFLDLAQSNDINKLLTKTKLHRFYLSQRAKGLKESTITRKFSSIIQFGLWLKQEGLLTDTPEWLQTGFVYEPPQKLADRPDEKIQREIKKVNAGQKHQNEKKEKRKSQPKIHFPKNYQPQAQKNQEQRARLKADLTKLSSKIQHQFNQTVKKFVPSGFLPFINTAVLVIFFLGASALGYKQFFTDAPINLAYPSTPTSPGRTLSFQGRLSNKSQSPITEPTEMQFKLWKVGSAGTEVDCDGGADEDCLWKSTWESCTVDPDQDGIFAVGLGDTSECPPSIPDSVFTENSNVWLEIKVETETLSPRQPIRTVGYATNAETVQGFPLAPTGGATTNTVLSMNNDGTILLAEDSPKLESTSGTFTVEGTSIVIQTTSNGNITLAPNGTGDINLQSSDVFIDKYLKHSSDDDTYLHYPDAEDSVEIYAGNVGFMTITEDDTQDKIEFGDDTNDTDVSFNDNDLFVQGSDSKIGIGTTTPDYELDVAGNIGLDQYLYHNGDADTYLNYTDDNVAVNVGGETLINLTEDGSQDIVELGDDGDVDIKLSAGADGALFVQGSDGNVGIGTTTPNAKLHVVGPNGTSGSPAAPDVLIITGGNAYAGGNGKGSNISLTAGNGSELAGSGGDITLTAGDGAWDGTGNGGNIYLIAGLDGDGTRDDILLTGNVGVNTTTPSYPLEVNGAAVAGGIYLNSSDVGLTGDADLISLASSAVTVNGTLTTTGAISAPTSTDTINGLVIDSGTITSGTWNGTAIGSEYGGTGDDTSSTTGVPYITAGNWQYEAALDETRGGTGQSAYTTGDILYSSASNTLDKLGIGSEGQILLVNSGIPVWSDNPAASSAWDDITDPDANLSLDMSTYTTTFNWATGTSTNDLFSFTTDASADGTGSLVNIQTGSSSTVIPLRVRSGSTEGLTVAASGNVGIGTTTPTNAKLDIVGGINASGAINATGALSTDSTLTLGSIGSTGDNNRILTSSAAGSGTVQYIDSTDWDKDTSDDLSGSGTTNYVTKWTTGGSVLGDSQIFDNGTNVGINTATPNHLFDVNGNIGLAASGYINWDTTDGESGYGFRDNSGTMEYKNSGEAWYEIGSDHYASHHDRVVDPSGNGTDTTIADAISNASAGDVIFIAPGTYSENITIDKSLTLLGASRDAVVINGSTGSPTILIEDGDSNGGTDVSDVQIYDLTVTNAGSASTDSVIQKSDDDGTSGQHFLFSNLEVSGGDFGINLQYADYSLVENCYIHDTGDDGLIASSSDFVTVKNSEVDTSGDYGINFHSSTNGEIIGNKITNTVDSSIVANGANNTTIANNTVEDSDDHGIDITGSDDVTISGNTLTNIGNSTAEEAISLDTLERVAVTGNTIDNPSGSGIMLDNVEEVSVVGNTIYSAGVNGIETYQFSVDLNDIVISGNNIYGSAEDGIGVEAPTGQTCTMFTIDGNAISGNTEYGLDIDADCNNFNISDNVFMENTSGDINNLGTNMAIGPNQMEDDADLMALENSPTTGNTYSSDLLQLTMDAEDADGFTGNGLAITVDQSQVTGYPLLIRQDDDSELAWINDAGDIYTAGNIGIGTTTPDYDLDVAGNIGLDQYLYHNGDADTFFNFTDDNLVASIGNESFLTFTEDDTQDIIKFADEGDIDINLAAGRNGALFIQGSDGNIGIGTTTPGALIQAYNISDEEQFRVEESGSTGGIVYADEYKNLTADTDYSLTFRDTLVSYTSPGAVMVGESAAGATYLSDDWVGMWHDTVGDDNVDLLFGQIYDNAAFDTKMMIDGANGNVGIGTASPGSILDIAFNPSTTNYIQISDSTDSYNERARLGAGSSGGYLQLFNPSEENTAIIRSYASSGVQAFFTAGNVGIGTTSPDELLHLNKTSTGAQGLKISTDNGSGFDGYIDLIRRSVNGNTGYNYLKFASDLGHAGTYESSGLLEYPANYWDADKRGLNIFTDNGRSINFITRDTGDYSYSDTHVRMVIDKDGNVGIGTTTPGGMLSVVPGSAYFQVDNNSTNGIMRLNKGGDNRYSILVFEESESSDWVIGTTDSDDYATGNDFFIGTSTTDDVLFLQASSGNVGVGTDSPGSRLTVVGEATDQGIRLEETTTATNYTNLYHESGSFKIARNGTGGGDFELKSNGDLALGLQGNVGIGTTSPDAKLHINGDLYLNHGEGLRFLSGNAGIGGNDGRILRIEDSNTPNDPDGHFAITYGANDTPMFGVTENYVLVPNGDVGIGTTSPDGELDITSSGTPNVYIQTSAGSSQDAYLHIKGARTTSTTSDIANIKLIDGAYGDLALISARKQTASTNQGNLLFWTHNGSSMNEAMRIDKDGNVGIGTTSPGRALQVDADNTYQLRLNNDYDSVYTDIGAISSSWSFFNTTASSGFQFSDYIALTPNTAGTTNAALCWDGGGASYIYDCDGNPGDLAEYYRTSDPGVTFGTIVSATSTSEPHEIKLAEANDNYIGIISTDPYQIFGESAGKTNSAALALVGRVPLKVNLENGIIKAGEQITVSSQPGIGAKALKTGNIVATSLEDYDGTEKFSPGVREIISNLEQKIEKNKNLMDKFSSDSKEDQEQLIQLQEKNLNIKNKISLFKNSLEEGQGYIMAFVNPSWYDPQAQLTDTGDFQLQADTTAPDSFQVTATDGSLIDRVSVLAEALIANLKAGFIQAEKIATSTLSATEAKIDELTTNRINLGEFELSEQDGNLQIKNKDQETVATIDQDGNTQISGNISGSSETQTASESGSLSSLGELLAENVNAENINTTNLSATGSARLQKLQAAEVSTETIKATGSSKLGSLLTDTASVSGQLQANSIQASTLEISGETKLGQLAAQSTNTQKLEISNDTQEVVASIDNTGTANFENLNINQNLTASHSRLDYLESKVAEMETIKANTAELLTATVSGTLYANNIDGFDEKVAQAFRQPSLLGSLLGESTSGNTAEVIAEVDSAGYTATSSAQLQQTIADLEMDVDDIVITPQAAYIDKYFEVNGSGYISDSLGLGQHLLIGDGLKIKASNGTATLSYLSESNPAATKLEIQPQGVGQVSILAGTMIINDTGQVVINGDLQLNGNLAVNGQTQTDTLLTNMMQPDDYDQPTQIRLASRSGQVAGASTESGTTTEDEGEVKKSRLEIIDEEGTPVATISASGRAEFADGLGIDQEDLSATSSGEIVAEKSSGKALIGAGMKELTIKSDRITEDTQIFVTPIGSTNNQVLYVKNQTAHDPDEDQDGEFVVGFDLPASDDIKFSWWIVN